MEIRDYLRRNAGLREEYARMKRDLAERKHGSIGHYAAGKSEVLEKVMLQAQEDRTRADDQADKEGTLPA